MEGIIGIVVPSYNQAKYVEKTLQSVIANRKNIRIKIAVIDGGSDDGSVDIIKKYADELDYWCSEGDKGQADAINKGISVLGECTHYMWLNSDDIYENDKSISMIFDYLLKNNYEVCYGLSHFIDEDDNIIGEYPTETFNNEVLGKRCYISQPSVIFSKKAFEAVGPLNINLKMCLDYEYWIRLAKFYEFGMINEFIGSTRVYGSTKTSTMQERHVDEGISILKHYYGKVPMHWIVTKVLMLRYIQLKYIPKRILMVLLLPFRRRIVKEVLANKYLGDGFND